MLFLRIRLYRCTVTLPICTISVYRCLNEWPLRASANGSFSVVEIESLAGLFQWVSIAWPAIIPSIASLQALKHSMKRFGILSRCLDVSCKVVVIDLASFFLTWHRTCLLFAGFHLCTSGTFLSSRRLDYFWDGRRLLPVLWLLDSWMTSEWAYTSVSPL
jgi:hypothetical protein